MIKFIKAIKIKANATNSKLTATKLTNIVPSVDLSRKDKIKSATKAPGIHIMNNSK
jgi:hypothetical protein